MGRVNLFTDKCTTYFDIANNLKRVKMRESIIISCEICALCLF